jgi:ABC-type phosphate transport system substrate-binding protein
MNKTSIKYWVSAIALVAGAQAAQADGIAVVMGPSAAPITKDQLTNIYLGRTFELKPIDAPEGNALRDQFYKKLADRDAAQVKSMWSRVVFTGKGQPPIMLPTAAEVKKAVATDPKAIGYIDKAAVDGTVKVVFTLD